MTFPYDPDYVVHPGEVLAEWFEQNHLPQTIATKIHGIPTDALKGILAGTTPITPDLAQRLCGMTFIGIPFWLAMEHNFRVGLAAGKHWDGER